MQRRGESGQQVKGLPKVQAPTPHVSTDPSAEQFDRLNRERDEVLEQLAATSEVLRVIRRSPNDVQPVFDMIAESDRFRGRDRKILSQVLSGAERLDASSQPFIRSSLKFTAILLVMMRPGRFIGHVRKRRFLRRLESSTLHRAPRGALFLLVALDKLRHWIMSLFAGPIALYPRGCGQWESRAHRAALSFQFANEFGGTRTSHQWREWRRVPSDF
jgi:hypothetical protein